MSKSTLGAFCPRICHYSNDGSGRDIYISSNNAGFYKDYRIINTNTRHYEPFGGGKSLYNPVFLKPLNRYYCDGMGRDHYIFCQNQRNIARKGGAGIDLPDILRNDDFQLNGSSKSDVTNPTFKSKNKEKNRMNMAIAKSVVQRVFYGNAEGVPERRMSPKAQFNKKFRKMNYLTILNENIKEPYRYRYYYTGNESIGNDEFKKGLRTLANFNCRYKKDM